MITRRNDNELRHSPDADDYDRTTRFFHNYSTSASRLYPEHYVATYGAHTSPYTFPRLLLAQQRVSGSSKNYENCHRNGNFTLPSTSRLLPLKIANA